jgi:hypothetical protein
LEEREITAPIEMDETCNSYTSQILAKNSLLKFLFLSIIHVFILSQLINIFHVKIPSINTVYQLLRTIDEKKSAGLVNTV